MTNSKMQKNVVSFISLLVFSGVLATSCAGSKKVTTAREKDSSTKEPTPTRESKDKTAAEVEKAKADAEHAKVIAEAKAKQAELERVRKIASNEATAIASLKYISYAQAVFIKTDFYEIGALTYANQDDGRGIADLYEIDGVANKILDRTVARADDSNPNPIPKAGYLVHDLKFDDYSLEYGALAYPAAYDLTGRNVFLIDVTGTVYQIDAKKLNPTLKQGDKITPFDMYPRDKDLMNWIPAGR